MTFSQGLKKSDNSELTRELSLALKCSLPFAELLVMRGIKDKAAAETFLNPSAEHLEDPFLINGMSAGVERLKKAIERREKVLIYGDYDCDGIAAIAILTLYLKDKINGLSHYIPDRNSEGYGMNITALEEILERDKPDLVVTVDTGITAKKEVSFLKSRGVDVIITDHHEPQQLPDAIIISPKLGNGCFSDYAGAGIAFKLVEALGGRREALKYIDLAAVATIADIVSLTDQNRIIAALGLKAINAAPRKGIELLLGKRGGVTANDIAFRLAPRVNAAGRVSSAMKAVDIFLSDDHFMLECLASELAADNAERQNKCSRIIAEAMEKLKGRDFSREFFIVLADESWEVGVLGIAAAKIAETFNRPAVLFSKTKDGYKGSARSGAVVDIFEALSAFSQLYTSFGGHSRAAGLTVPYENLDSFKEGINSCIREKYGEKAFVRKPAYDLVLTSEMRSVSFAKELERLEPTGEGNPKPRFLLESEGLSFSKIGDTRHIKHRSGDFEIVGFNFETAAPALACVSQIIVSIQKSVYINRDYSQAIIEEFRLIEASLADDEILALNVEQLKVKNPSGQAVSEFAAAAVWNEAEQKSKEKDGNISAGVSENAQRRMIHHFSNEAEEVIEKVGKGGAFGTLYVAFSPDVARGFLKKHGELVQNFCLGAQPGENPENTLILAPQSLGSYFKTVILLEKPLSSAWLNSVIEKSLYSEIHVIDDKRYFSRFEGVDKNFLKGFYVDMRSFHSPNTPFSALQKYMKRSGYNAVAFAAALAVFKELGLVKLERGKIAVNPKKVNLTDSAVFNNLQSLG
ncbi:MAG: single-stranded-DNA-specific exonuclease RecJ [Christensenellales bacterium]